MKIKVIFFCFVLSFTSLFAQVGVGTVTPKATLDISGNPTLTTQNDGLLPPRITRVNLINKTGYGTDQTGAIIYVTDLSGTPNAQTINITEIGYYYFDGTVWKKLNKELETTYETVALANGNQTISVRDADKIVGYTLLSNFNSLSTSSGKMGQTWIINDDRDLMRCTMQILEHPFIKFLAVSVQINNGANTITFSNYTSRYWKIIDVLPQSTLTNSGANYRLGKIIIIRKE